FDIEKITKQSVSVNMDHPYHSPEIADAPPGSGKKALKNKPGHGGRGGGGRKFGGGNNKPSKGGKKFGRPGSKGGPKGNHRGGNKGNRGGGSSRAA
ncbi:MAG: hypothetical protein KAI27_04865, partial [Rhodospirillaceae bacterium]|nr:hypothetical protein [Rhodospirillaceae bacterium]